jgi:hypothetical protein
VKRVDRAGNSPGWLFGLDRTAAARRILLLVLVPSAVFIGTLHADFVFDDNLVIFQDPLIVGPLRLGEIFESQVRVVDVTLGYFRPLITLLYRLDRAMWGLNPAGYHLTNLFWHLLATLLVYCIGSRTVGTATAWIAAMLFAVLPAHAEAVGWIQGRVDLVSTALVLVAFLALLRAREATGWSHHCHAALAGLAFLAALLSKESVAAFPLAWVVYECSTGEPTQRRRSLAGLASRLAPLFLAGLAYWLLRHWAVGRLVGFPMSPFPVGERLLALLAVFAEYVRILLMPGTSLDFHVGLPARLPASLVAAALIVGSLLVGGLLWAWRRDRRIVPWTAWVPIMLLPPLLFISYAPATKVGYYTAERFLYLPSVGWCVLLALSIVRLLDGGSARTGYRLVILSVVLLAYAGLTVVRLAPWVDPIDLYVAMKAQPDMNEAVRVFVDNDLGRIYLDREEFVLAREEFLSALRLKPDYAFAHNNMGVLLIREGKPAEALPWLQKAIHLDPRYADSYGNLGAAYEAIDNLLAAQRAYEAGLRVAPNSAWLAKGLARVTAGVSPARRRPAEEVP